MTVHSMMDCWAANAIMAAPVLKFWGLYTASPAAIRTAVAQVASMGLLRRAAVTSGGAN